MNHTQVVVRASGRVEIRFAVVAGAAARSARFLDGEDGLHAAG